MAGRLHYSTEVHLNLLISYGKGIAVPLPNTSRPTAFIKANSGNGIKPIIYIETTY